MKNEKNKLIPGILFFVILLFPLCAVANTTTGDELPPAGRVYEKWEWRKTKIQSIFDHISLVAGVDIVVDPNIKAEMSLSLRNKTWVDAFKVVCTMNDLHYEKKDNFIYVVRNSTYKQKVLKDEQERKNRESLQELVTKIVDLENTVASDMVTPIQNLATPRGKVSVVDHTNSLIIQDLERNIPTLLEYVKKLDKELLQISIEVKIVEVSSNVTSEIGVEWSLFNNKAGASSTEGAIGRALDGSSYGILNAKNFEATLDYLFTEANSEIVAEPHITTLENSEAKINMGSKIPITTLDEAGNTVTELVDAGTTLIVTPVITGSGQIKMALEPTKKSYTVTPQGTVINEQGAETNVVVKDGETIVIAGLTADEEQNTESGVPVLKDIPILGFFFKKATKTSDKKDLVIFVTPRIIKSSVLSAQKSGLVENTENTNDFTVE